MPKLIVYSRPGCHLCEGLIEELLVIVRGQASVETRNIEDDLKWQQDFGLRIPVVECGADIVCEGRLDRVAVAEYLAAQTRA